MQLGADGDLRLASVRRTNPLAPSAASSAGTKLTAPAIYEYDYAEMSDAAAPKSRLRRAAVRQRQLKTHVGSSPHEDPRALRRIDIDTPDSALKLRQDRSKQTMFECGHTYITVKNPPQPDTSGAAGCPLPPSPLSPARTSMVRSPAGRVDLVCSSKNYVLSQHAASPLQDVLFEFPPGR